MITPKTDLVAEASGKLLLQLQEKPRIVALTEALARQVQYVEDAAADVLTQRTIDDSEGEQLDVIGRIVGQAREGRSDAEYRPWLKARVILNRAAGRGEDVLQILALLAPGATAILFEPTYPAAFVARVEGIALSQPEEVGKILRLAAAGGVGAQLVYWPRATGVFKLSSQSAAIDSSATNGLADVAQTTGGHLAGVV